jgi:hypothetical protein
MKATFVQLALTVLLVSGTVAYATLQGDGSREPARTAAAAKHGRLLKTSGRLEGLYPGAERNLRVRVHNLHRHAVRLRWVKATIGDASPSCSRHNLEVDTARPTGVRIRPRSTRVLRMQVRMLTSTPETCQGARWPLRFEAKGRGHGRGVDR